jgi:hypothetical protein
MDVLVAIVVINLISVGLGCAFGWGLARLLLRLLSAGPVEATIPPRPDRARFALRPVFNTAAATREPGIRSI